MIGVPWVFARQLAERAFTRRRLDSLPYGWQPRRQGPIRIVHGHHVIDVAIEAKMATVELLISENAAPGYEQTPLYRGWHSLGNDLWVARLAPSCLEIDMPISRMPDVAYVQLVRNIQERGALESMPYCSQPHGKGSILVIEGRLRVLASAEAGLDLIPVLVDTLGMNRDQQLAKRLILNSAWRAVLGSSL